MMQNGYAWLNHDKKTDPERNTLKDYEVVLQLIGRPHGEEKQLVSVKAISHDDARRQAYKRAAFEGWRVRGILSVGFNK